MEKTLKFIAVSCALLSSSAFADSFIDSANVISVQPIMQQSNCAQGAGSGVSVGGSLLGGIAGGLLGNQVGGGNGRTAATAVGAVVGAMTGNQLASGSGSSRDAADCQQRVSGYTVYYEYRGVRYQTTTSQHPGNSIQVQVDTQVSVRPFR